MDFRSIDQARIHIKGTSAHNLSRIRC